MHDYHQLRVWAHARTLAGKVYTVTKELPDDERFGLSMQMRRSSVSVASNIAEGAARATPADFRRFIRIACGSASELDTQLLIALDVGLLDPSTVIPLRDDVDHIRRMLYKLERA